MTGCIFFCEKKRLYYGVPHTGIGNIALCGEEELQCVMLVQADTQEKRHEQISHMK